MPSSGMSWAPGMWPICHSCGWRTSITRAPASISTWARSRSISSNGGRSSPRLREDTCELAFCGSGRGLLEEEPAEQRGGQDVFVANEGHVEQTFFGHVSKVVG